MSENDIEAFQPEKFSAPELKNILKKARLTLEGAPQVNLSSIAKLQFEGPGVYAIYLDKAAGTLYAESNISPEIPIYVGKAVPSGWRQGRSPANADKSPLKKRLSEHSRSINAAENLDVSNFSCRFLILQDGESDLIGAVESELVRHYMPFWNSFIDGFGNHDPGNGRYNQALSEWDALHPGRPWAIRLLGARPDINSLIQKIAEYMT